MNRAWLRDVIVNNDRMTAVELIINNHKKTIREFKQQQKKKTWENEKFPCEGCEHLRFGVNNCGSTINCLKEWKCERMVIDEFIKSEDI